VPPSLEVPSNVSLPELTIWPMMRSTPDHRNPGGVAVDAYLTPVACRAKALDCSIRADATDDSAQKAAMLRYAEWWNRLAEYHDKAYRNERVPGSGPSA
jgi:hypothetical protein